MKCVHVRCLEIPGSVREIVPDKTIVAEEEREREEWQRER